MKTPIIRVGNKRVETRASNLDLVDAFLDPHQRGSVGDFASSFIHLCLYIFQLVCDFRKLRCQLVYLISTGAESLLDLCEISLLELELIDLQNYTKHEK